MIEGIDLLQNCKTCMVRMYLVMVLITAVVAVVSLSFVIAAKRLDHHNIKETTYPTFYLIFFISLVITKKKIQKIKKQHPLKIIRI